MADIEIEIKSNNSDKISKSLKSATLEALQKAGMHGERVVKEKIQSNNSIVTGRLINSITYAIAGEGANVGSYSDNSGKSYFYSGIAEGARGEAVFVGTNVEYAKYVEGRKPFLKNSIVEHAGDFEKIFKNTIK